MMKFAILLLLVTLGAGSATAAGDDPASEVIVTLSATRFDPATVEVRRGVRLTFHNLSPSEVLSVVSEDGALESWPLGKHGEWSHRFTAVGSHTFYVKQHPEVRLAVEVR